MRIATKRTPLALAIAAVLGSTALLTTETAHATWVQSSTVTDFVTDNGNGTWTYDFTVTNTSTFVEDGYGSRFSSVPIIIDWELPYFTDMGIVDVMSPSGWSWGIEEIDVANDATGWDGVAAWQDPLDPWYAGESSPYTTGTEVLHWYCVNPDVGGGEGFCNGDELVDWGRAISPLENSDITSWTSSPLSGFSFTANFGPTAAPYQASWAFSEVQTGDPAFPVVGGSSAGGVGSPTALGNTTNIPEPASIALLGLGLFGLAAVRKKGS